MISDRSSSVRNRHRRAVGTFPNRRAAEQALHELRGSGFPMDRVSVITKDANHQDKLAGAEVHDTRKHDNKADDGATLGAATGGALGGLTGLLVGLGTLAIPGVGPIMLAGATATALATTLAGTAIGAVTGGLLGALVGLGIPEEDARGYHERVVRGEYLVIVDGTDQEIARAETILYRRGIESYKVYDAPTNGATSTSSVATSTTPVVTSTTPVVTSTTPVTTTTSTQSSNPVDVGRSKHAVASFSNFLDVEAAIKELRRVNFPLNQLSLITRKGERHGPFAGIDWRDRFDAMRYGVPADRTQQYDEYLDRGDYLIVVSGKELDIRRAAGILATCGMYYWQIYDPTLIDTTRPVSTGLPPRAVGTIPTPPVNASRVDATSVNRDDYQRTTVNDPAHPRTEVVGTEPEVIIVDRRDEPAR